MIKIRLKSKKKGCGCAHMHEKTGIAALKEVSEEELGHIEAARLLEPEDLAFSSLFGDKRRIIIDFEQFSTETDLGKFVKMFQDMGYTTDWDKGTLFGVREYSDSSPAAMAQRIVSNDFEKDKPRKIHMKIGKWLKKTSEYVLKLDALTNKIGEFHNFDVEFGRITGNQANAALSDEELAAYYRNYSLLNMMADPLTERFRNYPYELQNWGDWWQKNAASLKKELKDSFHNDDVIVVTRHPLDVFRMADFANIESCHSPPSRQGGHVSQQYKCAVAEAHGHGAVAYVVDKKELLDEYGVNTLEGVERQIQDADHELFYDETRINDGPIEPKYRLRLRQMRYYDEDDPAFGVEADRSHGTEIAVPERRMYPAGLPGFVERIMKWAREEQQDVMSQVSASDADTLNMGRFIKFGGSYEDNAAHILLADLFADQFSQFEGLPLQDKDTEDELEHTLNLDLVKVANEEIDTLVSSWNERYQFCNVEGSVEAEEDGMMVTNIWASMRFEWDTDAWKSLPNPIEMRYCVDEMKEIGVGAIAVGPQGAESWTASWMEEDDSTIVNTGRGAGGRRMGFDTIVAHIKIDPEALMGTDYIETVTMGADGFETFCNTLYRVDRQQAPRLKSFVENYFKRQGHIEGGGMLSLGNDIENGELRYSDWELETEGDSYEGYDEVAAVMTVSIPNLGDIQLPADFRTWIMEHSRDINIELRRRIMAGPREAIETEYYIPSKIVYAKTMREGEEVYVRWRLELFYDSMDEAAKLLKEIIEEVTEEEVTETLISVIQQLLGQQQITEIATGGADWALKRWKNNFI